MKMGIIGGAGPYASALLYKKLVQESYKLEVPFEMTLTHLPFSREDSVAGEEGINRLKEQLQGALDELQRSGVTHFVLCCNTMHELLGTLDKKGMECISLPHIAKERVLFAKKGRVLLLGTTMTIQSTLYASDKIEFVFLNEYEQYLLEQLIDQVLGGDVGIGGKKRLGELLHRAYIRLDFDAVVLGCTDLSVLNEEYPLKEEGYFVVDTLDLAAREMMKQIEGKLCTGG